MAHHKSVVSKCDRMIPLEGWRFKLRFFFFFFLWIRGPFRQRGRAHYTLTHILKSGTEEIVFWHVCLFRLHTFTWEGYTSVCVCVLEMLQSVCTITGVPKSYCQLAEYMHYIHHVTIKPLMCRCVLWREKTCASVCFWCAVCISGIIEPSAGNSSKGT